MSKQSRPHDAHHRLSFKHEVLHHSCHAFPQCDHRCNMANQPLGILSPACAFTGLIATATRICEQRVHCTGLHPRAFGRFHPTGVSTASAGTLRPVHHDQRPCDKHIISSVAESRLLTSANNATCVAVVRRRCQARFQKKHRSSIPRNWSMHMSGPAPMPAY
jgi:hypothetical protein